MLDIGQLLRQTREAQELSLADVEEKTRIRQRFLNALESGDWDELPNEVVARGFIRRYVQFLGLDVDEVMAQLDNGPLPSATAAEVVTPRPEPERASYQPIELDIYERFGRRPRWLRQALGFALALVPILILGYLFIQFGLPLLLQQSGSGQAPPTVALPPTNLPAETPIIVVGRTVTALPPTFTPTIPPTATKPPSATPEPTATPTPTPVQPTPTNTSIPAEQLVLHIVVTQHSWTRIVTDGEIQVQEILDPGTELTYTAQQIMEFLTGNAAGVELTLNDQPFPPLGEAGEVVEYIWTVDNGKVVEITPTPTPAPTPTAEPATGEAGG